MKQFLVSERINVEGKRGAKLSGVVKTRLEGREKNDSSRKSKISSSND